MIVTGTYENGRLTLPDSVRLKHARVDVKVEIPDEELIDEAGDGGEDPADALMRDLDAIRGSSEPISDDGTSENAKFARAVSGESKYHG